MERSTSTSWSIPKLWKISFKQEAKVNSIVKLLKEPTNRRELLTRRLEERFRRQAKKQGGRMVDLNVAQDGLENAKNSILMIEKFIFALQKVTIPLTVAEEMIGGVKFLQAMHANLLGQIGPEEISKMKEEWGKQQSQQNGIIH